MTMKYKFEIGQKVIWKKDKNSGKKWFIVDYNNRFNYLLQVYNYILESDEQDRIYVNEKDLVLDIIYIINSLL